MVRRPCLGKSGPLNCPAASPKLSAMAKTRTAVGKRKLDLTNLEKALFPQDGIIKAELIEYYLKLAPTLLQHVKGRPLSLVRYPDGIDGEAFFQKQKPSYAPDWIADETLGGETRTRYIVATEEATLVWLANQACIELHQTQCRAPHPEKPDYMVFDLDPPEGSRVQQVAETASELKQHLDRLGYPAFVKTSGGKGLHVVVPIEPLWDYDRVFETTRKIAAPFVSARSRTTTLQIKKESRKGRILVDIYRNRPSQTIVAPYSVRGRAGAPVSMPVPWDRLEELADPLEYNLRSVPDLLRNDGDAWEAMGAYAVKLHDAARVRPARPSAPGSLEAYRRKRKFEKTPEPPPALAGGSGNAFVIHRHHASRLHYDLRLEQEGVLKSWAVPRGLPPRPGVKRLAVAVEDHPLTYLKFEGSIPRGEYGGGEVWVFALGKHEITKRKKDGFYFRLQSREIHGEYRMIRTRGRENLLERVDPVQTDWLRDPTDPMLCLSGGTPPGSGDWLYEVKWDGIRALVAIEDGQAVIRSRSRRDITRLFPELQTHVEAFRATCGLFDAEIVCLDADGKPVFENALKRLQLSKESAIESSSRRHPAVCYVFDCLYLDGRAIVDEPLERRRAWVQDILRPDPTYRVSEAVVDGGELFEAASRMGLEGIVAKRKGSSYLPGKRSDAWVKIKSRKTAECVVLGYTRGKGGRGETFGALQIGRYEEEELVYAGKVGSGFNDRTLGNIFKALGTVPTTRRGAAGGSPSDPETVWLEPLLVCEVRFASVTREGRLREPVFVRLRPDLAPGALSE